jgi:hypothetical protein
VPVATRRASSSSAITASAIDTTIVVQKASRVTP